MSRSSWTERVYAMPLRATAITTRDTQAATTMWLPRSRPGAAILGELGAAPHAGQPRTPGGEPQAVQKPPAVGLGASLLGSFTSGSASSASVVIDILTLP